MPSESVEAIARSPLVLTALLALAVHMTLQALAVPLSLAALFALTLCAWVCLTGLGHVVAAVHLRYVQVVLVTAALGHLGLLLGVTKDLGSAGLVILASWCSVRLDNGLSEALAMWQLAPLGHLAMLLGCNLGMLLSGCSDLPALRHGMPKGRFLLLCNLGMILGMSAGQLWQPAIAGTVSAVVSMALQMLFGMVLGMIGAWWLAERWHERASVSAPVVSSRR